MNRNNFAVIMAGGVGSRFWPVSTAKHPKQFRDLLGSGETLIQTTFRRLSALVPPENVYVLTNERYQELVQEQLPSIKSEQIVLEPVMRNTAPAVLLAALKIQRRNKDAVMVMAPSDHWIQDEMRFTEDMALAFEACSRNDQIITLGITPTYANTGYGYIEYAKKNGAVIKPVTKFTEKPAYDVAVKFLQKGNYLWNSGIFIWNVDFIIRSFEEHLPEVVELFGQGKQVFNTPAEAAFIQVNYPKAPDISIDYGILEKANSVYVIAASFDWNDLGTWGALYEESEKDENNNAVLNARVLARNATGNIVSSDKNRVVVVEGIEDFIIVDEEDVLLLVPRGKEQDIKQVRASVQKKFGENLG